MSAPDRRERGAAVVSALIIVAIVAALSASLFSARPPAPAAWRTNWRACRRAPCWPAASIGPG